MKTQGIGIKHDKFQAVLVATAEIASDIAKINWPNAVKGVFEIFDDTAKDTRIETSAPGREVAYISRAHEEFGRQSPRERNN
jgi:hypothetical protein